MLHLKEKVHLHFDGRYDVTTWAAKDAGRIGKKGGGRTGKQFGGGLNRAVARRDMRSGYYPNDMGMRGLEQCTKKVVALNPWV